MLAYQRGTPCVLLVGGFDGLHRGHEKLIERAKEYRLPVGIMTIAGGKGEDLFTLPEREKIFARQGIDFVLPYTFDEEMKNTPREAFLQDLTARYRAEAFVCGEDFRFGKDAAGDPDFLRRFTGKPVHALPVFQWEGRKAGMSVVKELLSARKIGEANALLAEPFFAGGTVVEGRKTGRTIDFPTANIAYPPRKFHLPEGVYAVHAALSGKIYRGIANLGACPTFGVSERKLEVYFDGFAGDLYGREIDVVFDDFLREIRKFPSPAALKEQLQKDKERIRNE